LAAHLGKTIEELKKLSAWEIGLWRARFRIDPVGEERADLRNAINCQTIAASMTGKRISIRQFMPDFTPLEEPDEDELIKKCEALARSWGINPYANNTNNQ